MAVLKKKEIKRGMLVKDLVSTVEGIADREVRLISGSAQFVIQPKDKKGEKVPDAWAVDAQSLVYKGEGIPCLPEEKTEIALGMEVRDRTTGLKGIADIMTIYLNGCVYFGFVVKDKFDDEKKPLRQHVTHVVLEKVGNGLMKIAEKRFEETPAPQQESAGKKPPGGPTTRVASRAAGR
jgi:hypothetical protein